MPNWIEALIALFRKPSAATVPASKRFTGITATVFGGAADRNVSAYDGHVITDQELGVALPYRFTGTRPKVRVYAGGKFVECPIVDVGPWNTSDPYWSGSGRPQAESGRDKTGRVTNRAGIDLTPAAARAIGIAGKGTVDWEFVSQVQSSAAVPPWLAVMKSITGTNEYPGGADNPTIVSWAAEIAKRFPEMASYCAQYRHDEIAWCGLTVAYCMAKSGIRPVFGSKDTDRFLWADAWSRWGTKLAKPKLGCVMMFTRNGGGHVSLYEGEEGDFYLIRGGNQSDSVNVTRMAKSKFTAAVWPA